MTIKNAIARLLPASWVIQYKFRKQMGYAPNLKHPKTFNEKLQWMKLHDRNPLYNTLVDKYEVKQYVAGLIGEEYIIPTYGVWERFDDIDFDALPDQFVLKCTHDSGGVVLCRDKATFDRDAARKFLETGMAHNFYYTNWEWPYKDVKPRIIAEKYMEDAADKELRDYKFYTFNGKPTYLLLATDRQAEGKELCFDYFDMEFNHLALTNHWHPNAAITPHRPEKYEEMQKLAAVLAQGIPQVRVDFYEVNGQVYFGEMTFFDMGGFLRLHPDTWDEEWGSLIDLES